MRDTDEIHRPLLTRYVVFRGYYMNFRDCAGSAGESREQVDRASCACELDEKSL